MREKQAADLIPCPFCGGDADVAKHYKHDEYRLYHRCPVIGYMSMSKDFGPLQPQIEQWNTRTPQPPSKGALEVPVILNMKIEDEFIEPCPLTGEIVLPKKDEYDGQWYIEGVAVSTEDGEQYFTAPLAICKTREQVINHWNKCVRKMRGEKT